MYSFSQTKMGGCCNKPNFMNGYFEIWNHKGEKNITRSYPTSIDRRSKPTSTDLLRISSWDPQIKYGDMDWCGCHLPPRQSVNVAGILKL